MQLDRGKHRIKLFLGENLSECSHDRYRFKNWHKRAYTCQQYFILFSLLGGGEKGYHIMGNEGRGFSEDFPKNMEMRKMSLKLTFSYQYINES